VGPRHPHGTRYRAHQRQQHQDQQMWGDGIFMQAVKDIAICRISADHNRRQGISVIEAEGVLVTNSVFKNTRGTAPSAGIDLEPDEAAQTIQNVRIPNSKFFDNAGPGILILGRKKTQNIRNVVITGNCSGVRCR
jgi:hypothetical protein